MSRFRDFERLEASPGLPPRRYSAEIPPSPSRDFRNDHIGASLSSHCVVNFRPLLQFHHRKHTMTDVGKLIGSPYADASGMSKISRDCLILNA